MFAEIPILGVILFGVGAAVCGSSWNDKNTGWRWLMRFGTVTNVFSLMHHLVLLVRSF